MTKMMLIGGNATIVGSFAALAIWLAISTQMHVWLVFLSWAAYFVFSQRGQTAVWALVHMIMGLTMAVALIQIVEHLTPDFGTLAPVAITFLFAAALTLLEKQAPLNNLPAYYFGIVAMFASESPPEFMKAAELSVPIACGFAFGWSTTKAREIFSRYAAKATSDRALL